MRPLARLEGMDRPQSMAEFQSIAGYEVISTLGYGARSIIYRVRDGRGDSYALKRVVKASNADQRFVDQAVAEHEIARRFNHPSLRRSFKCFKNRTFLRVRDVVVLMEYVDGQTLEQTARPSIGDAIEVCRQAAKGLAAMHEAGYVHADMKPNNVLVARDANGQEDVKLIDFGQSCKIGTVKDRIQGTPDYIAPEQVRRQAITIRTDVFNLGATMYWLLTRRHVPTIMPKGEVGHRLEGDGKCVPPAEINPDVPPALSSLVMDCIEQGPHARPEDMTQILTRLEVADGQVRRRERAARRARREEQRQRRSAG